jgi:hypothetical protein
MIGRENKKKKDRWDTSMDMKVETIERYFGKYENSQVFFSLDRSQLGRIISQTNSLMKIV